MIRLPAARLVLAAALMGGTGAVPAMAQVPDARGVVGEDKVNTVIVYGDDACPQSDADEIVVCARLNEDERYRVPRSLRTDESPANTSWAQRARSFEMVGRFGTLSCSPIGAGGFTGCTQQLLDQAYGERANSDQVRFGQLIDAARQDRLSQIDDQAAIDQAASEDAQDRYEELRRQNAAVVPPVNAPASTVPATPAPGTD